MPTNSELDWLDEVRSHLRRNGLDENLAETVSALAYKLYYLDDAVGLLKLCIDLRDSGLLDTEAQGDDGP